ncbi:MAG: hypothetical protein IPI06_04980 [Gammaproteobacteria bacterium]|nr:hypothetical protein [Gammaproteobacteria bacterium]
MRMRVVILMLAVGVAGAALAQSPPAAVPDAATGGARVSKSQTAPAAGEVAAGAGVATQRGPRVLDRMALDPTQITGNRELPKVLYIVPWKRADPGDLAGRPLNSLLDEVLAPIDRDVFRRQTRYYEALRPDAARSAPDAGPDKGGAAEPPSHEPVPPEPRHER